MNDCKSVEVSLAAGEARTPSVTRHLAGCEACAVFAADVDRLRTMAAALPRPATIPRRPDRARAPATARWLWPALTAVLLGTLVLGHPWTRRQPPWREAAAPSDPDLVALMAEARRVWTAEPIADGGVEQSLTVIAGDDSWSAVVDPLASLQPAAFLAAAAQREAASNLRRRP